MARLAGRIAVVTGATPQSIGEGYCRQLATEGARIVCADIQTEKVKEVAASIQDGGGQAEARHVDVGDEASLTAMIKEVGEEYGGIDILVNNAAIFHPGVWKNEAEQIEGAIPTRNNQEDLLKQPLTFWHRYLDINLTSVLVASRAVFPFMKDRGRGRIINQSSIAAYTPGSGIYGITKLGVIGITRALAVTMGPYHITVNAIAPGPHDTGALRAQCDDDRLQWMRDSTMIGRLGTPDEIGKLLVFLASDDSGFITGSVITTDGGMVMPF
jgi:NAD(P)-dependent dehydrogenase (short-subunit alcohol dehydrogenase family)